ncbi:ornithine cyclodeaminase [Clostridium tyrobutyricum]|uniref:tyramine oxidase subunit B n=1 Tax=Clostridium tyrobutyricum TaxID=1519 RepID=UPI001C38818B|nr:tyramine oxidase subunit B [Clostridium tyrobutyricum]MBV4419670.1 ornithine cyclodeaminase [Clostridium tyrobutyricum]
MESTKIDFLYLNEQDMIKAGVLDASMCIQVMGETMALLSKGDYIMGGPNHNAHGIMLEFPKKSYIPNFPLNNSRDRRFIAMPAYLGGRFHIAGQKWYGSNGRNAQRGLPRSILMVSLNDVETGVPIAYMSANLLSAMRTGAMPGLAAKLLARKDSKVLSIVGPGAINKACTMAIMSCFPNIETVKIKGSSPESKTAKKMKKFVESRYFNVKNIKICSTLEEAIRGADIVSEAASVKEGQWPKYEREWFKPGAVIISASTFNMEHKSIMDIKKVVDDYSMYEDYSNEDPVVFDKNLNRKPTGCMGEDFVNMVKDGLIERKSIINLGDIVTGKAPGRTSDDEVILVAIEGLPIEDVAWGYECYQNALKKGLGIKLNLWDRSAII